MLVLLAVATLAGATPVEASSEPPFVALQALPPLAQLYADRRGAWTFLRAPAHCKDAARIETGFEPALLFREQDRANARARRLIDLPPAEACLVGTPLALRETLK
jgi:hypothetical protein